MVHRRNLVAGIAAAAAGAALLAGCPLVQPLPGVQPLDGGTVTPPRVAIDTVTPSASIIPYETQGCPGGAPSFQIQLTVRDEVPDSPVEGRWFVDYDPVDPRRQLEVFPAFVSPPQQDGVFDRPVPPLAFNPSLPWSSEPVHVLEFVIANGFASDGPLPYRTPSPGNETQLYRWVFVPAPGSGACGP